MEKVTGYNLGREFSANKWTAEKALDAPGHGKARVALEAMAEDFETMTRVAYMLAARLADRRNPEATPEQRDSATFAELQKALDFVAARKAETGKAAA